jgi:hypothetical protein
LQDWLQIDAIERARGQEVSKPREKFTRVTEMLDIASSHRRRKAEKRSRVRGG